MTYKSESAIGGAATGSHHARLKKVDSTTGGRPAIAVFDHHVVATNPVGSRTLAMLSALADVCDFTVFAISFDNPRPDRIRHVPVRTPRRPLVLQYGAFHAAATLRYVAERLRRRRPFDFVLSADTVVLFADLYYIHFCNRAFLGMAPCPIRRDSLMGCLHWANHAVQARVEPLVFRRARSVIAVSQGLARELNAVFPDTSGKTTVIHNRIDVRHLHRPDRFDRSAFRADLGLSDRDTVLLFVAHGHFDRKGLPILLEAHRHLADPRVVVLVVGGTEQGLRPYRLLASDPTMGRVLFMGSCSDVRPYFWASDAFVFPSYYESFSLVSLEAAAAGLPVIAPLLHGIEEYLADGVDGFVVEQSLASVAAGIRRFMALTPEERRSMSRAAQRIAAAFDLADIDLLWYGALQEWMHTRPAVS